MQPTNQPRVDPAEFPATPGGSAGLDLFPVTIVAIGSPAQPVERLMALQSAVSRAVDLVAALRLPALRLPRTAWQRLRTR